MNRTLSRGLSLLLAVVVVLAAVLVLITRAVVRFVRKRKKK